MIDAASVQRTPRRGSIPARVWTVRGGASLLIPFVTTVRCEPVGPEEGRAIGTFERNGASIHYEEWGKGVPVLLLAPGGMRSAISYWTRTPRNPIAHLSDSFRVIAMDQRNAGESTAPISGNDGWHTYTADQLALMDHLGVERFHVVGMCIGGPYCMGLIQAAPGRVVSAVLVQPIGLDRNREAFYQMFDGWADELRATSHRAVGDQDWIRFRSNMYDGDFLFNVDRDFVRACETPLLNPGR